MTQENQQLRQELQQERLHRLRLEILNDLTPLTPMQAVRALRAYLEALRRAGVGGLGRVQFTDQGQPLGLRTGALGQVQMLDVVLGTHYPTGCTWSDLIDFLNQYRLPLLQAHLRPAVFTAVGV